MALFRFAHRWPAMAEVAPALARAVPWLDDRDRDLEDYLAVAAAAGGGGLTKVTKTGVALGTLGPSPSFTWTTVGSFAKRAFAVRAQVTSSASTDWGFQVRSQGGGAGALMLEASGIGALTYDLSWPWWWENGNVPQTDDLYIGARNNAGPVSTFTLATLVGEKIA
ncbi:MAG: hypothetical protein ACRD0D_01005 [Acidimicrobiales bacterium]